MFRPLSAPLGQPGWGIAWYINGLLIPVITVKRGVTYRFEVYGGNNPALSASYHPFYITNDPVGGYNQATTQERQVSVRDYQSLYILFICF